MQVKCLFIASCLFSLLTVDILLLIRLYLHLYSMKTHQGVSHFHFKDDRIENEVNAKAQVDANRCILA